MLHAVDDVSFSIEKGKTMGIVGNPAAASPRWDASSFICWTAQMAQFFLKGKTSQR
jgi:ABC-type microcin C transport system duplicated ATPase subunit YejF